MIREEKTITTVRFYHTESDDPYLPYDAVCTVVWESPDVVWIKAMNGKLTRKLMCDFVVYLYDQGVKTIKSTRGDGKTVPFVTLKDGNYFEIDVEKAMERIAKRRPA